MGSHDPPQACHGSRQKNYWRQSQANPIYGGFSTFLGLTFRSVTRRQQTSRGQDQPFRGHRSIFPKSCVKTLGEAHPRRRERCLGRCKSPGDAPRFLAAYGPIASPFRPRRHLLPIHEYRQEVTQPLQTWRDITGTTMSTDATRAVSPSRPVPGDRLRAGACDHARRFSLASLTQYNPDNVRPSRPAS